MSEISPNLPPAIEPTPPSGEDDQWTAPPQPVPPNSPDTTYPFSQPDATPIDPSDANQAVQPERIGAGIVSTVGIVLGGLRRKLAQRKAVGLRDMTEARQFDLDQRIALDEAVKAAAAKTRKTISGEPKVVVAGTDFGKKNRTAKLSPHGNNYKPGGRPKLDLANMPGGGDGRHVRRVKRINRAQDAHNEAGERLRQHTELYGDLLLDEQALGAALASNPTLSRAQRRAIRNSGKRAREFAHERHESVEDLENTAVGRRVKKLDKIRGIVDDRKLRKLRSKVAKAEAKETKTQEKLVRIQEAQDKHREKKARADESQSIRKIRRRGIAGQAVEIWREKTDEELGERERFYDDLSRALE
ncbi:hypothetical protein E6Q11_04185, partial [Candidatus Dojkabacteria bacterium]